MTEYNSAADISIGEMMEMQRALQEKYKERWEAIGPETGKNKLLWMVSEVGEVVDIVKKDGHTRIMEDEAVRRHFVEEMADVLMYFNDIMLCYNLRPEELKTAYTEKFQRNLTRW